MGELGRAVQRVLTGFGARIIAHDPCRAPDVDAQPGAAPVALDTLLATADTIFVTAAVTTENQKFLGAPAFAAMKPGAAFILLSRADVVDFEALCDVVAAGHIQARPMSGRPSPFPRTTARERSPA